MSLKRLLYAAALCVPLVAVHAGAQTASEPAAPASSTESLVPAVVAALTPGAAAMSGPVRNIVLVHGAFVDGSSWNGVIAELQKKGYNVSAVQNPLTSLADDADAVRQVLARQTGPTLLVGHSWGGTVITEAGADAPNVVGLVYIAAFGLDNGESLGGLLSQGPTTAALEHLFTDKLGFGWLSEDDFVNHFASGVDPVRANVLYAVQQPLAVSAFADVIGVPAWKSLPTWSLVGAGDEAIPPDAERQFASRMGATTIEVESGHLAMVSHPDETTQLIRDAAEGVQHADD